MNRIAAVVAGLSLAFVGRSITIAATINVPGDYPTIQGAIDAAEDGDTVQIDAGTYIEKVITNGGKSLVIQGTLNTNGSLATIIDAQGTSGGGGTWGQHIFDLATSDGLVVIRNLELTGGHASYGGAVHFKDGSLTLDGCYIHGNVSRTRGTIGRAGSASANTYGKLVMTNCTFEDNTSLFPPRTSIAYYNGGQYYPHDLTIQDCTFRNGTGMAANFTNGVVLIERCTVSGTDPYDTPLYRGNPLLDIRRVSSLTINDSSFSDNLNGAGIDLYACNEVAINGVNVKNNTQPYDTANGPGFGAGIGITSCASASVTNCIISGNSGGMGGGISVLGGSNVTIDDCTIKYNNAENGSGGGLLVLEGATCNVNNTNFHGNNAYWEIPDDCDPSDPWDPDCFSLPASGGNIATTLEDDWSAPEDGILTLVDSIVCAGTPNNVEGSCGITRSYLKANCMGECCIADGCLDAFEEDCVSMGGTWSIFNVSCLIAACDELSTSDGACCLGGTCIIATATDCVAAGGAYGGDNVACADANCATTTPGDVDGDGDVDTSDLDELRGSLGLCTSDTDMDGDTDIEDLLNLIEGWGNTCTP